MSSFKKAQQTVEKNKEVWTSNLPSKAKKLKRRCDIALVDKSLVEFVRLPLKKDIVGRFLFLYHKMKERKSRIDSICEELMELWSRFSFPTITKQVIIAKIRTLLTQYDYNMRKKVERFQKDLITIFDITKSDGLWLCHEDKALYSKQIESSGIIRTSKVAPSSSIHPSKLQALKLTCEVGCSSDYPEQTCDESESVHSRGTESAYHSSSISSNESSVKCHVSYVTLTFYLLKC